MKKTTLFLFIFIVFFSACAKNKKDMFSDYNLSDKAWLEKIISNIKDDDLEKADSNYVSLYSEHINSPLLSSAMLILSNAHADAKEYLLANYYLDEYNKLYGSKKNSDWINYLKIKNNFYAFKLPRRNQYLMLETLKSIETFKVAYPDSKYLEHIKTIETKLNLTQHMLDIDIRNLYKRMNHDVSVDIYNEKIKNNNLNEIQFIEPKSPWYRKIFESSYIF